MSLSFASTSSKVQDILKLFWLISKADVATPPALAAFAGANKILLSTKSFWASKVEGIFAPSPTAITPLSIKVFALLLSISFWVAQGSAISHLTFQIPPNPSVNLAVLT